MSKTETAEGNPETFDPSTASLDDLKAQLAEPTQVDEQAQQELNPEPEAAEPEDEDQPEPEAEEEPEGEPEQDPEGDPEPQGQEEPQSEEEEPDFEEEPLKKRRVRPRNQLDQQVMDLYRSEGFEGSMEDAVKIIYANQQAPDQPQQEAEAPDPVAGERSQLEALNSEISEIEKQLNESTEELDTPTALKLQRELLRKENEVGRIELRIEAKERELSQSAEQTLRQQAVESRDRALEKYPDLASKDSPVRKQFDAYIQTAQADPVQAPIFNSPRWPEIMANQFAVERGMAAVTPKPEAPAKKAARRPTGTRAKQLTGGEGSPKGEPQVTVESLRANMGKMERDDLFNLLKAQQG